VKIAVSSLNQVWEDKRKNREKCLAELENAAPHGVDLHIFPEMTLTGFSMNAASIAEDFDDSESIRWFRDRATKLGTAIVFGIVLKGRVKPYNSLLVVNKNGRIIQRYDKLHTFSFANEPKYYKRGNRIASCRIKGERIGFSICYDLRFPSLFEILSRSCSIIVNIANWPESRIGHWKSLLVARAIECQSFMIGVNRTGIDGNGIRYIKSSMTVSPTGVIMDAERASSVTDVYLLDHTKAVQSRKSFPTIKDRRNNFYSKVK
jgi:omega-amidase